MCNWCKKDAGVRPMVSSATMPMICKKCGTRAGDYDYKQMRALLLKHEKQRERSNRRHYF